MMQYTYQAGTLTVSLPDRLSGTNSEAVRNELNELVDGKDIASLVFDAGQTEYVSSSGLRVLLQNAKRFSRVCVVNAKRQVYDVLDMTGMTEIITVEKALDIISIDGCPVIGRGQNGTVYRCSEDSIVKVYTRPGVTYEDVRREHLLARKALILGIPTAISFDVVRVGGYYGAMYEMVGARSLYTLLQEHPEKQPRYIQMITDCMKQFRQIQADNDPLLVDKKAQYIHWMQELAPYLQEEENAKTTALCALIPECSALIHGDLHPGNIMVQDDELYIIDMDSMGYGALCLELSCLYGSLFLFKRYGSTMSVLPPLPESMRQTGWKMITDIMLADLNPGERNRQICLSEVLAHGRVLRTFLHKGVEPDSTSVVRLKQAFFAGIDELLA